MGVCTLGDDTVVFFDELGKVGSCSIRFREVVRSSKALQIGSPACKEGVVVEGGCVKIVMMSVAACFKKLTNLISGKITF